MKIRELAAAWLFGAAATACAQQPLTAAEQSLPAVTVVGARPADYATGMASAATKSDAAILDTPMAVQVVPRSVMDDQQAHTLADVLKNVSSVQNAAVGTMAWDNFVVRGFSANQQVWLDGMRLCCANFDTDNLEAVEVLKGPAGILYGRLEPGGMINLVSKKPQAESYRAVDVSIGSWDFYKTSLDMTGALDANKSLLYRLNATYLDTRSFIDYDWNQRVFIAPSFTYRYSPDTEFSLQYAYKHDRGAYNQGVQTLAVKGGLVELPYGLSLNGPYSTDSLEDQHARIDWSQRLNADWKLVTRLFYGTAQNRTRGIPFAFLDPDGHTAWRNAVSNTATRRTTTANIDLSGAFDALGMSHALLAGVDTYHYQGISADYYYGPQSGFVPPLDLLNPIQLPVNYAGIAALGNNVYSKIDQTSAGVYVQDRARIGERWHLLVGGRYDATSAMFSIYSPVPITGAMEDALRTRGRAFSPNLGALYKLRQDWSLYGSYAKSTAMYGGQTIFAAQFPPTRARQIELGAKHSGRLDATFSIYDLIKDNVPTPDPDPSANGAMVLTGQVRSRGAEFDVSGDLTRQWSVIASLSMNDTRVTQDNLIPVGSRLPNVARSQGSLWTKYRMGDADGVWNAGIGVFAAGRTETSAGNTGVKLPGYAYVNAMMSRAWWAGAERYTAALNIENLFERRYYPNGISNEGGNGVVLLLPGAPRSVRLSLKTEF